MPDMCIEVLHIKTWGFLPKLTYSLTANSTFRPGQSAVEKFQRWPVVHRHHPLIMDAESPEKTEYAILSKPENK
jgi:hypothetical protein